MIDKCETQSYKLASNVEDNEVQGITYISYGEYVALTKYKYTFSSVLSFGMRMRETNQQNRDILVKLH